MTLINIRNLGVTLNAPLFSRLDLSVNAGDRIGLVAANGRGKSTLLRCIAGMTEPSDGEITRSRGLTIGYVEQDVPPALADKRLDVGRLLATDEVLRENALDLAEARLDHLWVGGRAVPPQQKLEDIVGDKILTLQGRDEVLADDLARELL